MVTFVFTLLLGTFIVISDKILEREVNRYAIDVFSGLLMFLAATLGISVADKKLPSKNEKEPTEE